VPAAVDTSTPLPQCQEVLAFLKVQFVHDIIGPELSVSITADTHTSKTQHWIDTLSRRCFCHSAQKADGNTLDMLQAYFCYD
jgi:hypothetical protein